MDPRRVRGVDGDRIVGTGEAVGDAGGAVLIERNRARAGMLARPEHEVERREAVVDRVADAVRNERERGNNEQRLTAKRSGSRAASGTTSIRRRSER